jgi:hypothetical protein
VELEKMSVEQLYALLQEEDRKLTKHCREAKARIHAIRKVHDTKVHEAKLSNQLGKMTPDELTMLKGLLSQKVTPGPSAGNSAAGNAT